MPSEGKRHGATPEYFRQYYQDNRERRLAYEKERRESETPDQREARLAKNRAYYQANKQKWNRVRTREQRERHLANRRAKYHSDPEVRAKAIAAAKASKAKLTVFERKGKQYGVAPEVIEELYVMGCAICKANFEIAVDAKWAVDHDHATGNVRGVLCQSCNIALGHMYDDPIIAFAAFRYLMDGGVA
ncbi:endonuclease domain-containing protein [Frankia sp. Cj3]|uniref:endonuclease domain-containing protein n=1 Tax=Frankia sp. Cj3 TaxID=2880976 RepID=UPI001EF4DC98|nr:endonuclease domain-containing protein [Frankia sp. Cj3]